LLVIGIWLLVIASAGAAESLWHFLPADVSGALIGRDGQVFRATRGRPVAHVWGSHLLRLRNDTGKLFAVPTAEGMEAPFEIKPAKGASFQALDDVGGALTLAVSTWEDASGRLWIGNTRGVQWRDANNKARERTLCDPNGLAVGLPMTRLHVEEGGGGRLYLWATPSGNTVSGTAGFWRFDGKAWAQFSVQDGLPEQGVRAVLPIDAGTVWVNTIRGKLIRFRTVHIDCTEAVAKLIPRLNSREWKERRAATDALKKLGRPAELPLKKWLADTKELEVRSRIKMVLDALKRRGQGMQVLPGGRYRCAGVRVRARRATRRGRPVWLASASSVTDTQTGKQFNEMAFLLTAKSATPVPDWPRIKDGLRTWVWIDSARSAWLGAAGLGLFHWDGTKTRQVTDESTGEYHRIIGRDRLGRILLGNGSGVAAYWPGKPDTRRRVAGRSWRLGLYGVWGVGSDGRVWAKLSERAAALSVYENGRWRDVPGVRGSGPSVIIPGRKGAVFVNMAGAAGQFYLLDGAKSYEAGDLAELAAKHQSAVRAAVDPAVRARSSHYAVTLDAKDRLWVVNVKRLLMWPTARGKMVDVGATLPKPAVAFPWMALFARYDRGRTLLFARVPGKAWHIRVGGSKWKATICPDPCPRFGLFERRVVDGSGRLWHGHSAQRAAQRATYRHTATRIDKMEAAGVPVLADSAGRVWLCRPGVGYNVVGGAAAKAVAVRLPSIDERTPLCERRPGEVWIACRDGLRRFTCAGGRIEEAGVFRRGFPVSGASVLRAGASGTLWLSTASREGHRLTEIRIPKDQDHNTVGRAADKD
jgi:hypothetical protein